MRARWEGWVVLLLPWRAVAVHACRRAVAAAVLLVASVKLHDGAGAVAATACKGRSKA